MQLQLVNAGALCLVSSIISLRQFCVKNCVKIASVTTIRYVAFQNVERIPTEISLVNIYFQVCVTEKTRKLHKFGGLVLRKYFEISNMTATCPITDIELYHHQISTNSAR